MQLAQSIGTGIYLLSLLTFLALLGLKPARGLEAALQLISTGLRPFKNLLRAHDVTSTLCAASGLLRALHEEKKNLECLPGILCH